MPRSEGLAAGTARTNEGTAGGILLEKIAPLEFTAVEFGSFGRFGCAIDRKSEESRGLNAFSESHERAPFSGGSQNATLQNKSSFYEDRLCAPF